VRRIAVLDNNRDYLEIVQDLLQDEGFAVVTHEDLSSGYGFVQQQRPDLAIVDILQHREPLGLNLLVALRQDAELRALPVVVASADEPTLRQHADQFEAEGFAVLSKPFDLEELLRVVCQALDQSGPLPTTAAVAD
jgi:DNA-binding response OmpR family regulator